MRTPEREPTSYHFSSLWAELEALLESVLLLDWLAEYGASGYSEMRNQISIFTVFLRNMFYIFTFKKLQAHSYYLMIEHVLLHSCPAFCIVVLIVFV